MRNKIIFLVLGIIATIVFFVLRDTIYEALYFAQGFSDQMYNLKLYTYFAGIIIAMTWGGAAVYYYLIDSVRFDRWYHWLITLAIVTLITPVTCYIVNDSVFADNDLLYISESIEIEFFTAMLTALMFIIASFSIRWWSSNCRHTPIPQ